MQRTPFIVALLIALAISSAAADGAPVPSDAVASETSAEARDVARVAAERDANSRSATFSATPTNDHAIRMAAYSVYPPYTIRRTVPEVRLQFSVTDERGRLVTNLTQKDFRILDNQSAVQRIRQFSRMEDLPLQLGLLLDVSDSVQKTVTSEKQATQLFLQQVVRPQTDRAFLMAFGHDVKLWQPSTSNRTELSQALQRIQQSGYAANLYDGLFAACFDQFPQLDTNEPAHRVIVLFSDGEDTDSLHGMQDVIALAQRKEIQIYAISVHLKRTFSPGDEVLQRLADRVAGAST